MKSMASNVLQSSYACYNVLVLNILHDHQFLTYVRTYVSTVICRTLVVNSSRNEKLSTKNFSTFIQ